MGDFSFWCIIDSLFQLLRMGFWLEIQESCQIICSTRDDCSGMRRKVIVSRKSTMQRCLKSHVARLIWPQVQTCDEWFDWSMSCHVMSCHVILLHGTRYILKQDFRTRLECVVYCPCLTFRTSRTASWNVMFWDDHRPMQYASTCLYGRIRFSSGFRG
jgi:hypothetical protein